MNLDLALDAVLAVASDADAVVLRDVYALLSLHTTDPAVESAARTRLSETAGLLPYLAQPAVTLHSPESPLWASLQVMTHDQGPRLVERLLDASSWLDPGNPPAAPPPVVVAFYSYKGGVGRTTAAALTALKLARQGQRVVLVDFDLEAPGLHSLLETPPAAGVVDFLLERQIQPEAPFNSERYAAPYTDKEVQTAGGQLHIVPAGAVNDRYLAKMGRVDLAYDGEEDGAPPLGGLVAEIQRSLAPDIIVMDARTGLTDIGGVLLNRVSHVDVVVAGTGRQHNDGLRFVLQSLREGFRLRGLSPDEIGRRLLLVVSRVPWSRGKREDQELETEIRGDLYDVLSDELYKPLWPTGESPPNANDRDVPFAPVIHDPVIIRDLAELSLQKTLEEIDYVQSNVSEPPFDRLVERLVATKLVHFGRADLAEPTPVVPRVKNQNVATVRDALASFSTDGSAEHDLNSEANLRNRFLPLPQFRFLFDPQAFLVLGRKGSGKSALFQVLRYPKFASDLAKYLDVSETLRVEADKAVWTVGYDRSSFSATLQPEEILRIVRETAGTPEVRTRFWKYLAAHVLHRDGHVSGPTPSPDNFEQFYDALRDDAAAARVNALLAQFGAGGQPVYLVYDDLDRLVPAGSSDERAELLNALLGWWQLESDHPGASALRSKVFLRSDIFELDIQLEDKSKIRDGVRRHTIAWSEPLPLYRLLLRWAPPEFQHAVEQSLPGRPALFDRSQLVGAIPTESEGRIREVVEWLVGEHMGANVKKGYSYTWIPNHLSDGKDKVAPRSFLALFTHAAQLAATQDESVTGAPTPPNTIRQALRSEVSTIAVDDLKAEYGRELQTSNGVFIPLALSDTFNTFPQSQKEIVKFIERRAPDLDALSVIKRLVEIGVFIEREVKRKGVEYQIPDIYLYGLGLTRRG